VEVAAAQFAEAHAILGGRFIVDAARDFAHQHRLDLPDVPVADAVAAFVEDRVKAGASKRYLQDLRTRLVHGFAAANVVNLGDLTADRLRQWLDNAGGGPRHHNNNLAAVRTLVRFCIGRRWLPKDADLLEGVTKRKADAGPIEIWTPKELAAPQQHDAHGLPGGGTGRGSDLARECPATFLRVVSARRRSGCCSRGP